MPTLRLQRPNLLLVWCGQVRRGLTPPVCDIKLMVSKHPAPMPKTLVRVYIDPNLRDRFAEQFPGHGSLSWVLETAIQELLQLTDGSPPLADTLRAAIRHAVLQSRKARATTNDSATTETGIRVEPT